jgi:hypothetical protein
MMTEGLVGRRVIPHFLLWLEKLKIKVLLHFIKSPVYMYVVSGKFSPLTTPVT